MPQMTEPKELLLHELGDLLYAERRFLTATKTMARETQDPAVKRRVEQHVGETETQIERLEKAFESIGEKAKGEKCEAAIGLREEHDSFKSEEKPSKTILEAFDLGSDLFGRAHRSTSQSEQQRYILSEEDVRGLDDRKQFLFVNNTKPILADKIRYYEEPFFKARTGDYFHGVPAAYEQRPGAADLPGPASIDWRGVRAVCAPPEPFAGVRVPKPRYSGAEGPAEAPGEPEVVSTADYLTMAPIAALRADDDDGSL